MTNWTLLCGTMLAAGSLVSCGNDGTEESADSGTSNDGGNGSGTNVGTGSSGTSNDGGNGSGTNVGTGSSGTSSAATGGSAEVDNPLTDSEEGPLAGNPEGDYPIAADAAPVDVSSPDEVVGNGTPKNCTSDAVVAAVAAGGIITFDCGPDPVTITMTETAVVRNDSERVVIDGGGLVTLSGGSTRRILYQNTCDHIVGWTSPTCDNQPNPELVVQNITFINGNARWSPDPSPKGTPAGNHVYAEYTGGEDVLGEEGGGAIYAQGGRLKIVNSRFFNNECADLGSDIGGGAVRAFQQYGGLPIYVVNSTFGGAAGFGNQGANGGAIASIGVSWTIINSLFSHNAAVGNGASDGNGGNGGAIYNDGDEMTLRVLGTCIEHNTSGAFGSAIFFVSNNHTGDVFIEDSIVTNNAAAEIWEPTYPQISNHDDTPINVTNSTVE